MNVSLSLTANCICKFNCNCKCNSMRSVELCNFCDLFLCLCVCVCVWVCVFFSSVLLCSPFPHVCSISFAIVIAFYYWCCLFVWVIVGFCVCVTCHFSTSFMKFTFIATHWQINKLKTKVKRNIHSLLINVSIVDFTLFVFGLSWGRVRRVRRVPKRPPLRGVKFA